MAKIYVSSTFNDLQEYREQVRTSLRSMGHEDIAMEYYTAGEKRPVDKCIADVERCDMYVGIFAFRYGYVPKDHKKSVTEQEYRAAVKSGKACLIFLLKDDAPWPVNRIEIKQLAKINKLRKELSDKHSVGMFTDKNDLAKQVTAAIYNWALEHGHIPATVAAIPQFDLEKYYNTLRKRYGVLALEGLTPPQKEEYLQIQLRSVFVEQSVRESPPPIELPKEVWEKLSRDKEIHPEDLPSGIALEDIRKARETYYGQPACLVLDVLTDTRYQRTIILGDPGSGKSTLARYVMLSLIDTTTADDKLQKVFAGYLPLLIELRTYAGACSEGNCGSFLEFLEYLGKTEGWALTQSAVHNHLKNDGHSVVIFDGLDEIFDPEQRERITHQIVGFCGDYPKARVIVTTRVIGYRRKILTDASFTHFTLQDLGKKQVELFVTRWYDLAMSDRPDEAGERRERILKSFQESASIRQLAGNPMLLTIMAIIGKHQELPRERWKLYDHAASVLIQHWDVNKHLKDKRIDADFIGEDDKKELLRRLAFRMQSGDGGLAGNYILCERLQTEFENYLIERYSQTSDRAKIIAEAMIQQFRERNFILSLYGANLYGFVHRAFLEYFCASAFVWKFEKTKELTIKQLKTDVYGKHWEDQSWQEVLRLICGMIDEKWAGNVIGFLAGDINRPWPQTFNKHLPLNILLAVQCLREVKNLRVVEDDAKLLLQGICDLFEYASQHRELDDLLSQVTSEAKLIGRNWPHRKNLVDWLRKHQLVFNDAGYCYMLGEFIGSIASGLSEAHDLISDYMTTADEYCSLFAYFTFLEGWPKDSRTASLFLGIIVDTKKPLLRYAAILWSERFRDNSETLPLLRKCAAMDGDSDVRGAAFRALAEQYSDDTQIFPFLCDRAIKEEAPHKEDKKKESVKYARESAIDAIAEYWPTHPETIALLHNRAKNDPTPWLRKRAKELIAKLEGKKE